MEKPHLSRTKAAPDRPPKAAAAKRPASRAPAAPGASHRAPPLPGRGIGDPLALLPRPAPDLP